MQSVSGIAAPRKWAAVAVLAVAATVAQALGEGADFDQTIDEFLWGPEVALVTATREEQHPFEAPATAVIITAEMIRQRGYLDLKDVLADLPGFDLSTDVYGEFATLISQRGIGGNNKLVLLLDGEEFTAPSGKQFPFGNNVPVSLARRIEVVYGPASANYGPDAFGVINIITRDAGEIGGLDVESSVGADATWHGAVHFGRRLGEDAELTLYGRRYVTDGQDLSGKYPELAYIRSGYPEELVAKRMVDPVRDWNFYGRLKLGELTLGLMHSSYHEQLADGLIPQHYVYDEEAYWGQSISRLYLQHRQSRGRWELNTRAALAQFEIDPEMNWFYLLEEEGRFSTLKVHQYGRTSSAVLESQCGFRYSERLNLLGGLVLEDITGLGVGDVYGEPFDRSAPLLIQNYGVSQAALAARDYGAYLQMKWRPGADWHITLGTRYDYNTIYGGTHNPRLGLVYRPDDRQAVKLLYGEAYIAPSYFDRYETWFLEEYGHIQNPDLQPETMRTVELNYARNWSGLLETSISLYHNHVENLIVRRYYGEVEMSDPFVDANGDGRVFVEWSDNFGQLDSYGADVRGDLFLKPGFVVHLAYSFMDGENTDPNTGEELDLFKTSKHKIMGGLVWTLGGRLTIAPRLRWVSDIATRQENALYAGSRMPGYQVATLNVRLKNLIEGLEAQLTIDNLTDARYYTAGVRSESTVYLPRVPQDGRRVMLGLNWHPSW